MLSLKDFNLNVILIFLFQTLLKFYILSKFPNDYLVIVDIIIILITNLLLFLELIDL